MVTAKDEAESTTLPILNPASITSIYEPLADPAQDIRLLRVLGERAEGRLQVQLWNVPITGVSVAGEPSYRCLSYMWGEARDVGEILLNGHLRRVRQNVYEFLEHAVRLYSMQPLWIDSLCIDQDSIYEKNIQVTRMGLIYNRATEIIVWLGHDPLLLLAARFINQCVHTQPSSGPTSEIRACVVAFWSHPYWRRIWITQELLVARSIQVLVGSHMLSWHSLHHILDPNLGTLHEIPPDHHGPRMARRFYHLVTKHQPNFAFGSQDIWTLHATRGRTECSTTSDRIYALLTLVKDGETFRVSYEEEIESLFWRAGEHSGAWSSVSNMLVLKQILRLSNTDIARTVGHSTSVILYLQAPCAYFPRSARWPSLERSCEDCGQEYVRNDTDDIVFCTKPRGSRTWNDSTHVVVRRNIELMGLDGLRVSLVPGFGINEYATLPVNLIHRVKNGWVPILGWNSLNKMLDDSQTIGEQHQLALYLPPEYVLYCLQSRE